MPALSLPQPSDSHDRYHYVPYDVFDTNWLGDPRLLQSSMKCKVAPHGDDNENFVSNNPNGNTGVNVSRYAPGALVWVLLSKGKPKHTNNNTHQGYDTLALHKKRRDKKNKRKNIGGGSSTPEESVNEEEKLQNGSSKEHKIDASCEMLNNHSRKEFFLRARVISDDEEISKAGVDGKPSSKKLSERRILVRYSRGATYRVRAYNLIPVLEPSLHNNNIFVGSSPSPPTEKNKQAQSQSLPPLVVIVPETNIYRRVAKVHTTPDDSFMEIGCDYGITVDKIQTSLEEAGDVPKVWPADVTGDSNIVDKGSIDKSNGPGENDRVSCLGVDRSIESIDIANERYPKCKFALGNVLVSNEMASIRTLCEQSLKGSAPSVICIDINGNREIEGVLECLAMVINEQWKRQPRMIIVKSRFLYWELKKDGGC